MAFAHPNAIPNRVVKSNAFSDNNVRRSRSLPPGIYSYTNICKSTFESKCFDDLKKSGSIYLCGTGYVIRMETIGDLKEG